MSGHPVYGVWATMIQRCHNPNLKQYARYGARGITVCQEWRDSFEAFLTHIGPRPSPEYSIDRIDNDKGYFPGNVRWATRQEQVANRRTLEERLREMRKELYGTFS